MSKVIIPLLDPEAPHYGMSTFAAVFDADYLIETLNQCLDIASDLRAVVNAHGLSYVMGTLHVEFRLAKTGPVVDDLDNGRGLRDYIVPDTYPIPYMSVLNASAPIIEVTGNRVFYVDTYMFGAERAAHHRSHPLQIDWTIDEIKESV